MNDTLENLIETPSGIRWLKAKRALIEQDLNTYASKRYLSPFFEAQYRSITPLLQRYVHGHLIDLGCGMMPLSDDLLPNVMVYHGFDIQARSSKISLIGDIQNMSMIRDCSYDSALCFEVLEHVPDPTISIAEIFRILKPGGVLLGSVPHLSRLHEQPHDYYRFTNYALQYLFVKAGFQVQQILRRGGLFSFLGHQVSSFFVPSAWGIPFLGPLVWSLNKYLITLPSVWLDSYIDRRGIFALGYVFVVFKPSSPLE